MSISSKPSSIIVLIIACLLGNYLNAAQTYRMQLLLDDVHPIYLTIEKDGKELQGKYILLSSGTEFRLEGRIESGRWTMREIDTQDQHSGWIVGQWEDQCFYGTWFNWDKSLQRSVEGCDHRVLHARDNKEYRMYSGDVEDETFRFGIYRLAGNQLILKWWSIEQQIWATYRGRCPSVPCQKIVMTRLDPLKKTAPDSLRIELSDEECSLVSWRDGKQSEIIECRKLSEHPFQVDHHANYFGTFDVVYPMGLPESVRKSLDQTIVGWKNNLKQHSDSVRNYLDGYAVSRRMDIVSYGWLDIDWWNDQLLSARLYLFRSYGPGLVLPLLIDLEEGEQITRDMVFRMKGSVLEEQMDYWWRQSIEPYCMYEGEDYCEWLQSSENLYLGIQPTGVTLSNAFDAFYGKHTSTLRYEQIEQYMRGKNRWKQQFK